MVTTADKFRASVARDQRNTISLEAAGCRVLTIWECEVRDAQALEERLRSSFLFPDRSATLSRISRHPSVQEALRRETGGFGARRRGYRV